MGEELKIMIVGDGVGGGVGGAGGGGKGSVGGGNSTLKGISNFLTGGLGALIGGAVGAALGGPAGATLGASIGKAVVSFFIENGIALLVAAIVGTLLSGLNPIMYAIFSIAAFLTTKGIIKAVKIGMDNSVMVDLMKKTVAGGLGAILDSIVGLGYIFTIWLRNKLPEGLVAFLDDPIPF